ncbi:pyridine nucleotide-disulfide oxidoreductase [Rhodothalassium salexigens]|uniref:NAD(P)/FAD-dependent oxidoreductase n=1 Tax=Rhodothalassium salexigens TaxID=1086 RepID=UPI0019133E27|nr:FAD/NAD(P)-binding oxidoreductase [Rhodothalassium salexigens]MBK5910158.1 pyridine nucleotide-disulfide oxidoreductase [Rhodothalassium salexigens]MBK5920780.1 pyridine nucleotide-disulfide oxidoreductase [Rhodothalassium salexigens]
MPNIIVMGGGIGGITMAYELRHHLGRDAQILLISDRDTFQFTPSNPWVAVGWRRRARVEVPLAPHLARHGIRFDATGVAAVHPERSRLTLADGRTLDYDYLVVATGPELAFDAIPGCGPDDGHTQSVCTTPHAAGAHTALEALAADPGPVVVGSLPGASCFGPAYEYAFVLDRELRRRKIRHKVPMTFVTAEPYIGHLGLDGVGDTKSMLESELRDRHIPWITNARTTRVDAAAMTVEELDDLGQVRREHRVDKRMAMMLPPFRGVAALAQTGALVNDKRFVLVDDYQRNPAYPNVYAVGVCVAIPPIAQTPVPCGVPKTGFMIETMANAAARNIRDAIAGRAPSYVPTWNAFCLADYGNGGAAFLAIPQTPPRNVNWAMEGRWVHYAKIAYEWYFMRKLKKGVVEPFYEKWVMRLLGASKVYQKPLVDSQPPRRAA